MAPWAAFLALFLSLASAEVVPFGDPPEHRLKSVPKQGFTLDESRLKRYGYTPADYQALSPGERGRVADWIKVLEWERELDARRWTLRVAGQPAPGLTLVPQLVLVPMAPPSVVASSAVPNWTPGDLESIGRLKAGTMYDGSAPSQGGDASPPYFTPHVELFGGVSPMDGSRPPGLGVRRFNLTTPDGLKLEAGFLGLDGRSPLIAPSPYFNGYQTWEGSGKILDYGARLQVGAVNLGARLYHDRSPLDDRIDAGLLQLQTLDPTLGLKPEQVDWVRSKFAFGTDYERQWLFIGSALGYFGRAVTIYDDGKGGGVDLGFSAMGLLRVTQYFPNGVLDQTGGARYRLNGGAQNFGFFAGVTEGLGLLSQSAVQDGLAAGKLKTDIQPQAAPHLTGASWGKVPYLSGVQYSVTAGGQFNHWTTVKQVAGGLSTDLKGTKVGVFGGYEDERGFDGEYQRKKAAAGVTVSPLPGLSLFGQYSNDKAVYGTAAVDNHAVLFGITATESMPGYKGGGSITMTSLFGGKDRLLSAEKSAKIVEDVQDALDLMRQIKDRLLNKTGGPEAAWRGIQAAWARLDPNLKNLLNAAFAVANPGGPSLDHIISTSPDSWATLNQLANLLSNTEVLERLMVRYIRAQILDELKEVEVPILGKLRMSAPMVMAAAHAYGLSLTPVPPITSKDRAALDAYILNKVSKQFGCKGGPQPQSTTDCILGGVPEPERQRLKDRYGDDLNKVLSALVSWPSGVIQREMNALALQVILASERLNELTVDEGKRIGDMNVRSLMRSFDYLDKRTRSERKHIYLNLKKEVQQDLDAIDAQMRETLAAYGASRLAWLKAEPSWPAGVDVSVAEGHWAGLLAVYGDKALFDLILRCKGALAAKPEGALAFKTSSRRLVIMLDQHTPLGATVTVTGDPIVLKLPPKGSDLSLYKPSF